VNRLFAWLFQTARTAGDNSPAVNNQGDGNLTITYGEPSADVERRHQEQMAAHREQAQAVQALREAMARDKGVDPHLLLPIFEHLGETGLSLAAVRERAEGAIRAILEQAGREVQPSNDGGDIAAAIGAARARLRRLETADAVAGLATKIAEETEARRQRLTPLLREKAEIERLTYDHEAAKATLRQLVANDPDDVWGWHCQVSRGWRWDDRRERLTA
jgi:hypothetical protein